MTTNGSACGGIAGLLHNGANVDLLIGQCGGNGGDDTGAVHDHEADVMRDFEFGADVRGRRGNFDAARTVREREQIADHCDRGGMAAGAVAGEDHIAAVVAGGR